MTPLLRGAFSCAGWAFISPSIGAAAYGQQFRHPCSKTPIPPLRPANDGALSTGVVFICRGGAVVSPPTSAPADDPRLSPCPKTPVPPMRPANDGPVADVVFICRGGHQHLCQRGCGRSAALQSPPDSAPCRGAAPATHLSAFSNTGSAQAVARPSANASCSWSTASARRSSTMCRYCVQSSRCASSAAPSEMPRRPTSGGNPSRGRDFTIGGNRGPASRRRHLSLRNPHGGPK